MSRQTGQSVGRPVRLVPRPCRDQADIEGGLIMGSLLGAMPGLCSVSIFFFSPAYSIVPHLAFHSPASSFLLLLFALCRRQGLRRVSSSTGCRYDSLLLLRAPNFRTRLSNSVCSVTRHIASVRLYDRYHTRPQDAVAPLDLLSFYFLENQGIST
ncbi:hypothetical protein HDV57DRAFT_28262 [Trichoderma longibrachiatum]